MTSHSIPRVWLEGAPGEPQFVTLIGPGGRSARLYCPFVAVCIQPVGPLHKLQAVMVTKVCTTTGRRLVYIIAGRAYFQRNFRILIEL